jgi:hypothetical protein
VAIDSWRKTFIVLVAIPSHSFDPAKTVADIGGRMTQFKLPEWTVDELTAIALLPNATQDRTLILFTWVTMEMYRGTVLDLSGALVPVRLLPFG